MALLRLVSQRLSPTIVMEIDQGIGEVMAIMGPSGSGYSRFGDQQVCLVFTGMHRKTTLLNVLARRGGASNLQVNGDLSVNESSISTNDFRSISSYVEQEDALIGSLTVRETIDFAGRLSLPR